MPLKLKLDETGNAVLKDGNPLYVHDDGKELPHDANATIATISRLNGEAKSHRERAEAAEEKLKPYSAIPDVEAALAAMDTVGKLDAKKLIDVGAVDKVREEAKKAFDTQLASLREEYKPVIAERDTLRGQLVSEKVGGAFSRSKFITEKLVIPPDMVQARFGNNFKLEGEAVIAYDGAGNKIFSRAKPGEVADFDEAMEILVDHYPYRDNILKGSGASGSGAGGSGGASGGKKVLNRQAFDALEPSAQRAHLKTGTVVDN